MDPNTLSKASYRKQYFLLCTKMDHLSSKDFELGDPKSYVEIWIISIRHRTILLQKTHPLRDDSSNLSEWQEQPSLCGLLPCRSAVGMLKKNVISFFYVISYSIVYVISYSNCDPPGPMSRYWLQEEHVYIISNLAYMNSFYFGRNRFLTIQIWFPRINFT